MALRNEVFLWARQCFLSNIRFSNCSVRLSSSEVSALKSGEEVFDLEEFEDKRDDLEAEIEAKRNKSRLSDKHRDMLMGLPPRPGSDDFHKSIKYKRKIYGMYGSASGIDPGTLWPDKADLDEIREYESVAYPETFHQMVSNFKIRRAEKERNIQMRQQKIADNMKKLSQWIKEVEAKKEKKLKDMAASKEKRDKMLDEVRKQLGGSIDVKDERFQLALAQKEKDMKKKLKEEKAKAKQERLLREFGSS